MHSNEKWQLAGLMVVMVVIGVVACAGIDNHMLWKAQQAGRPPNNGALWRQDHFGRLYRAMTLIDEKAYKADKAAAQQPKIRVTIILDDRPMVDRNAPPQAPERPFPDAPWAPKPPAAESQERLQLPPGVKTESSEPQFFN